MDFEKIEELLFKVFLETAKKMPNGMKGVFVGDMSKFSKNKSLSDGDDLSSKGKTGEDYEI